MLEITFGEIADGCADTTFHFGPDQGVEMRISYLTEPFQDLAVFAMAMLRGDESGEMGFTDEYDNWFLNFQRQPDRLCSLRLEQWTPWTVNPTKSGCVQTEDWQVENVEPWHFGFRLWSELARVQHRPGVLRWINDDEGCLPEGRFNRERDGQIAALEKALMG